jgi:hypothetical protein
MSNLRQAAQDVLDLVQWIKDRLDVVRTGGDIRISPILIDKLRAALAEPDRKPLSAEDMAKIINANWGVVGVWELCRAIEAAHGIKEQEHEAG